MELVLNLVWVCVAIAGVLVLAVTLLRDDRPLPPSASCGRKIIAMSCTLVILFFVISMTDDLHDQEVLIEERKTLRISAGTETVGHPPSARSMPLNFLMVFLPVPSSLGLPVVRRGIDPAEFLFAATIDHENLCSRAPPILLA